jgi:hypothetical protein
MTLCTRYDHLCQIWPSMPHSVTIYHLYRIYLSVPDMTICTGYDYLYRWSYPVQMFISGTDGHIWYRWSYPVQIVISSTDSHIWYRWSYHQIWPSVPDMTICTRYDSLYQIWTSVPNMTIYATFSYYLAFVPDMTICTRYHHLPDMTICTGYDHLYHIQLLFTICTGYDYLYWICRWSYLVQMVISCTDSPIWCRVISGTDGHIR